MVAHPLASALALPHRWPHDPWFMPLAIGWSDLSPTCSELTDSEVTPTCSELTDSDDGAR